MNIGTLAPLQHPDPAVRADLARVLGPFRRRGVLGSLPVHVVDHLAPLFDERDPEVLLALALAARAPSHGHICVDLHAVEIAELLPELEAGPEAPPPPRELEPLELPKDRQGWLERVARSPMVRDGIAAPDGPTPFVIEGGLLYTDRYHGHQSRLAGDLRVRMEEPRAVADPGLLRRGLQVFFGPSPPGSPLDRQRLAAAMAALRGLTVISGGPGTGKTWTVRAILGLLWAQWATGAGAQAGGTDLPGPAVALAAPTGKAVQRMKESLRKGLDAFLASCAGALPPGRRPEELGAFLDQLTPSTLHRLLGVDPRHPTRFRHHRARPLPFEVVVVDEVSMVDLALMARLVEAVHPDARLILLGDKQQLASVEAGTVLADICGPTRVEVQRLSEPFIAQLAGIAGLQVGSSVEPVPTPGPQDAIVQLDRVRRFAPESGIGRFAAACVAEPFVPALAVDLLAGPAPDVRLLPHGEGGTPAPEVARAIAGGYAPYLEALFAGPARGEGLDAFHRRVLARFDTFRVLCAHRRGRVGVAGMNGVVVELLRAARARRPGLRGLAVRGTFWPGQPILVRRNDYDLGLFNGDIGLVVRGQDGGLIVVFPGDGPEGVRRFSTRRLPEHEQVFAMTIHKSQGSEFEHAMVVLPEAASPILTRELIYTGVTRASRQMTLVGDRARIVEALGNPVRRASGLTAKLWGREGEEGGA